MGEELPAVARARIAGIRSSGTWGSALTAAEFAAVRGAGFEPVGQVFGAAVYRVGFTGGYNCPGTWRSSGDAVPGRGGPGSSGFSGAFGELVRAMHQAGHTAIERMSAECAGLGGHGVVGVRVSRGSFLFGGAEFRAIGTAVRALGAGRGPSAPFTCDLTGSDFAKLIMKGWVPAGLVLGVSIGSRHDDWTTARQTRWRAGNTEVAGWTELVTQTRHDARRQLEDDVRRLGAEGVVVAAMDMRVRQRDCPAQVGRRDHIVEATFIGTAVARFAPAGPRQAGPSLTIMSLDARPSSADSLAGAPTYVRDKKILIFSEHT